MENFLNYDTKKNRKGGVLGREGTGGGGGVHGGKMGEGAFRLDCVDGRDIVAQPQNRYPISDLRYTQLGSWYIYGS